MATAGTTGSRRPPYEAAAWLEENYPGSYLLPNHPPATRVAAER